eukprot:TRINITY_DN1195_c0_g1_i1.p1 TRINITY_DN1195_c0_g1~~TRINITY_DN1195_c0_g1_i1.p1  ORF type:complete len:204 (+),score=73.00 TRINITY_DN1195_c0_g1_i1:635-1246(+)
MGIKDEADVVYAIDFGLTKRYKDLKTGQHIPYRTSNSLTGTARYVSINTHLGAEQSRRDDLEGIAHVLLYFLRGSLPWQGLPAKTKQEKYKKIMEVKVTTIPEVLCKGFPKQISRLLKYCRSLKFEEIPNYRYIKKLLREVGEENSFAFDNVFDWTAKIEEEAKEQRKDMASTSSSVPCKFECVLQKEPVLKLKPARILYRLR